jgi:hypothetical protein
VLESFSAHNDALAYAHMYAKRDSTVALLVQN